MPDQPKVKITRLHRGQPFALFIPAIVDRDGALTITWDDAIGAIALIKDSVDQFMEDKPANWGMT